jgi:alkylation response protein AidB-like acyl-CoA dehydrogenase
VGLQLRLAEADAALRAAPALLKHDCAEISEKARDSQSFTLEERVHYRGYQSNIAKLSVQVIDRVSEASGGRALFEPHPLQRFHRDVHAASHHVSLAWVAPAEQFGKVRLELGPERPDL